MTQLRCESVSEGLRASEAIAIFRDFKGRRHFLRVERDFLSDEGGTFYLPIGVVHVDPRTKLVLIELPHEAETGANRLWVEQDQLDELIENLSEWVTERMRCAVPTLQELVEVDPDKRGGVPVLKGTRITVAQLIAELAEDRTMSQIATAFRLDKEQIRRVLEGLSVYLDHPL